MNKHPLAVGVAVAAIGVGLSVGTAVADDLPGNGCSVPCPSTNGEVLPNAEINASGPAAENASVLPASETAAAAAPAVSPAVAAATTSSSGLPVTGGDIAGMTALGAAALGSGTFLVRRGRKRHA
jgi:LPXTG-motif cell wall-anchored protein